MALIIIIFLFTTQQQKTTTTDIRHLAELVVFPFNLISCTTKKNNKYEYTTKTTTKKKITAIDHMIFSSLICCNRFESAFEVPVSFESLLSPIGCASKCI